MRAPFWSDDFDGDLLKLLPSAEEIIAPIAHHKLWTWGGMSHGRLNHPTCWHTARGLTAFFTHVEGFDPRPSAVYHISYDALVECTVEEFFRDLMVHQLVVELRGPQPRVEVFDFAQLQSLYHTLLFYRRDWMGIAKSTADAARERLERHLRDDVLRLADRCDWALPIPAPLDPDCARLGCARVRTDDCPPTVCNRGCHDHRARQLRAASEARR